MISTIHQLAKQDILLPGCPACISIKGQEYRLAQCPLKGNERQAFTVEREDKGEVLTYVCRFFHDGHATCTCPDFIYRSGPLGKRCKHLIALVQSDIATDARNPESDPRYLAWIEARAEEVDCPF